MNRLADYERGRSDAAKYSEVRWVRGAWVAVLQSDGSNAWILDAVNDRYLDGLAAGGCLVELPRIAA